MSETCINLMVLEDEVLEAGPACRTEIVIPCPSATMACKVSDLIDETR